MPYSIQNAPPKDVLPKAALKIWVETWNSVFDESDDEDSARTAAWSNVKKAGYRKGDDGKWTKAAAAADDVVVVEAGDLHIIETAEAMALPKATLSKVYAEFKYASFGEANANGDGFLAEDVTDEHLATLIGSPIYLQSDAADHPLRAARASKRAPFWAGAIVSSERRVDGIWCIGAFQREILEDRGIDPKALDQDFSVSMEVTFDRTKSKYRTNGNLLTYSEAREQGIASPVGFPDDPAKYDARFNVPIDFHGTALLRRGRNADRTADIVRVAAAEEPIVWNAEDYALHLATKGSKPNAGGDTTETEGNMAHADAAALSTEERKGIPASQFAYVDDDGEGHLPIHDAAHVKNALARLNQTKIPEAAKRKALKKILRAAKKHDVDVDKDSDVMKRYGAHLGMEGLLQEVHEAFYNKFAPQPSEPQPYPYIRATYEDYVIAEIGDKTYRIDYAKKDDDIEFGDPAEVEVVYKPVKAQGAKMSDDIKKIEFESQEALDAFVQPKIDAALEAKRAEIEAAAVEKAKPEIAAAAVEAHKAREKALADRMKDLGEIAPVEDAERADLEKRVREADDAAFLKIRADRLEAALKAARKEKVEAAGTRLPAPTLRGNPGSEEVQDPYDVTVRKN